MDIIVNHSSMQPIYEQIGDQIKEKIMHGILKADTPLPSVRTLAKELKVSALTVKKAYDDISTAPAYSRSRWIFRSRLVPKVQKSPLL